MAIIATYIPTGKQYVIVGTGFGATTHLSQGFMGYKSKLAEAMPMVVVADSAGALHWVRSEDLRVTTVEGTPISEVVHNKAEAFPVINPE